MNRFRDACVQQFGYRWNWRSQTTVDHKIQKERTLHLVDIAYAWWNRAIRRMTPMTTWPPRPRAPSTTWRTWISTREWYTRDVQFSSHVLVVMICTPHRDSSFTGARISWSSHEERISSILSSPFHPISKILLLIHQWCRIPECSWNRTVFHDERYCRILTIHRCSGLSWVHSVKRRKNIWTERLDQREHQNWVRIGSYNFLLTRKF